jgi:hypothetical protein
MFRRNSTIAHGLTSEARDREIASSRLEHDLRIDEPVIRYEAELLICTSSHRLRLAVDVPEPPGPKEQQKKRVVDERDESSVEAIVPANTSALDDLRRTVPQRPVRVDDVFGSVLRVAVDHHEVVPVGSCQPAAHVPAHRSLFLLGDHKHVGARPGKLLRNASGFVGRVGPVVRNDHQLVRNRLGRERRLQRLEDTDEAFAGTVPQHHHAQYGLRPGCAVVPPTRCRHARTFHRWILPQFQKS